LIGLPGLPVWLIGIILLWISAALTLATGWDYLVAGLRHAATPGARGAASESATNQSKIHLS
jgi:cardiolipin synthase